MRYNHAIYVSPIEEKVYPSHDERFLALLSSRIEPER
jgi:hypothetical protein